MKKWVKTTMISLTVIIFIGMGAALLYFILPLDKKDADGQTIEEMNEYSYVTPEVTTDLQDNSLVRIEFRVITDGKDALKEIEQREFQVQNVLIKELSLMSEDDFSTGLEELELTIMNRLNEVMESGKITDVYTTNKILQ